MASFQRTVFEVDLHRRYPEIFTHHASQIGSCLLHLFTVYIFVSYRAYNVSMPVPILTTKLYVPTSRPGVVLRPSLIARLDEGLSAGLKLILISAPAGFGKTTLLSEWLGSCQQREPRIGAAWLSLDEGDSDPSRFLTYLISALQTIVPDIGDGLLAALQSPQPPPIESLLAALVNEITTIPNRLVLVLDDCHVVESQPVDHALAFLLEHLPPQVHLVIATREDPSLPLARLRARAQLTELRAADLRFTPAEAAEFLNQAMGLGLSEEDINALEARTEGWIAGLQMAAISLQGRPDASSFIQSFTGSHHFVLDYLLEEVLCRQPDDIQAFLLRTSILERLCGPLCEAVLCAPTASGQAALEYLEHANLFIVPLDDERRWYRYHHLFGDLLRRRLGQDLSPAEVAELHLRASAWYETNGQLFEAFHHAVATNDVERAGHLIESREMGLHFRSVAMAVLAWLVSLPAAVLDAHPLLWVRSATVALMAGQTAGVEERLQAAEKALESIDPDEQTRDLIGQVACARATLALTHYDPETMLSQAHIALEHLSPDNLAFRFTANWALASASFFQGDRVTARRACVEGISLSQKSGDIFSSILSTSDLGQLQELDNQLHLAAETYRGVLRLFGDHPLPNAAEVYLGLARIHYEWNDLEAAEQYAQKSLELARLYDRVIDRFIISEVFLARLILARGDVETAAAALAQTEQTARQKNFLLRLPEIAAEQALVLLRQGKPAAAAQLAQQYELPLSQACVLLAQGDSSGALTLIEPFRQQVEARGWQDERLKAMTLQAVALYGCGEKDRALQVLRDALALAEPGGFIRLFIDEGPLMAQLLAEASAQGVMPSYVDKLLAAIEAETQGDAFQANPALRELLSQREIEVLQLIAQGLSNQEIGERLFLALDTVKGHNRRIFDKLQVQRRTEAIARARELGLL
jgi:LuxR family maltose regulon positive regulatory protein